MEQANEIADLPKIRYIGVTIWPQYLSLYSELYYSFFLYNRSITNFVKKKIFDIVVRITPNIHSISMLGHLVAIHSSKVELFRKFPLRYDAFIYDDESAVPIKAMNLNVERRILFALNNHRPDWRIRHKIMIDIGKFDTIAAPHRKYIEYYENLGLETYHIPFGVPWLYSYPEFDILHKNRKDVIFIGSIVKGRGKVLQALRTIIKRNNHDMNVYSVTAPQSSYRKLMSYHLYNLDLNRGKEVNWRTFEVPASGSLLISGADPEEISEFFKVGKEVFVYEYDTPIADSRKDPKKIMHIAKAIYDVLSYVTEDPEGSRKVAINGCMRAWKDHLIDFRIKSLVEILGGKWKLTPVADRFRNYVIKRCRALKRA